MRENLSMREAIQAEMAMVIERKQKRNNWSIEGEEGIQDDVNAGQMEGVLWNLPNSYNGKHWRENLHVELTEDEATHLKELILGSKNPLMVCSLLRTIIEKEKEIDLVSIEENGENSFETFAHAMKSYVSTKMWEAEKRWLEVKSKEWEAEGIRKGIEQGIEQGSEKKELEMYQTMVDKGFSISSIASIFSVSEESIKKLLMKA